jgi:hypothetical protein
LQHFLRFNQNQEEMSANVVNFQCPPDTAAWWKNTFSRPCAEVVKMVFYGDVCFEQRAVTEFLLANNKSVTNIQKQLKFV